MDAHEGRDHHGHQNHHAAMAADFRKRFWISLVLTLPILLLSPLFQALVGLRGAIHFPGDIYLLLAKLMPSDQRRLWRHRHLAAIKGHD